MANRGAGSVVRHAARRSATYALAPVGRRDSTTKFVILCPPRTGSELLVTLLDSHPKIRGESEILVDPPRWPVRWLDGRAALATRGDQSAWGCKIVTNFLVWNRARLGSDILDRLQHAGFRFVVLRRRNWLLQALSMISGIRTRYHHRGAPTHHPSAMDVVPEEVLHFLWMMETEDDRARYITERFDHLPLWYEDDLANAGSHQGTVDRVAGWLGLGPAPARTDLTPGLPPALSDRVANLDELAALLRHTRYARFLDN